MKVKRNDTAQIGIGTLIIFIAMILIAAVVAAILIQTSIICSDKKTQLDVQVIEGIRINDDENINLLEVQTALSKSSMSINLDWIAVSITDGNTKSIMAYSKNENADSNKYFTVKVLRDKDGSLSRSNPVINKGDIVTIHISGLSLPPGTNVSIILTSISEWTTVASFKTPSSYDEQRMFLYP